MISYIIMYIFALGSSPLKEITIKDRYNNNKALFTGIGFAFLLLGFFIGLRNKLGIDDNMYISAFNTIAGQGDLPLRNIEYSYVIIAKIVLSLGLNYQAVFFIYAILSCLLLSYSVRHYVKGNEVLFISLFFSFILLDSITLMRQFLALSLLLCAHLNYSIKKEKKKAIIFFMLAVFAHVSAIVGLAFFLLEKVVNNTNLWFKISSLIICYLLQFIPINGIVVRLMENISFMESNYYVKYYLLATNRWFFDPIGYVTSMYLILFILILILGKKSITLATKYQHLYSFTYLYFISRLLLSQFGYMTRISWFLSIFLVISLCTFSEYFKNKDKRLINFILILGSTFLFIIAILEYQKISIGDNPLLPYSFNFNFTK